MGLLIAAEFVWRLSKCLPRRLSSGIFDAAVQQALNFSVATEVYLLSYHDQCIHFILYTIIALVATLLARLIDN